MNLFVGYTSHGCELATKIRMMVRFLLTFLNFLFLIFDVGKPTQNLNMQPHGSETTKNSTTAIIIVVCVAFVVVVLGAIASWYCMFRRGKTRKDVNENESYGAPHYPAKRRDVLSSTSSSMSNCSTNPLLERHSIRYLKRQNSSLSHVSISHPLSYL